MTDLQGQVAVITGSTSGIGLAFARTLHQAGAHIMLNGLGEAEDIEAVRAQLEAKGQGRVRYHGANMLKPPEISDLVHETQKEFGRLDILVCNAGVQHVSPVERFPEDAWDRIMAINLSSAFHAMKAAVPLMRAQKYGRLVSLASAHGLVASPFKSAYVASKHGLLGLMKTIALEVAEDGITCNALCPGYVKTPLVEDQIADTAKARGITEEEVMRDVILQAQPTRKFVTYEELGAMLLYLVSQQAASVNGAAFSIDGGWTAR